LLAYILGPNLGFAVTYRGHPAEGVVHGEAALRWADRIDSPRLTAFVLATTARAHAKVGDERACLTLLAQAERERDRCPPGEEVADWLTVFDAAALEGHRGSCLLDLARLDPAVDALGAQDAAAPRCFARNRVIWLLDRTRAHLELGDLEAACAALDQAL